MQEKFVLRTLKKVAAIGTGVAMLGATLTGALALDLKDYPSPYVKDGVYDSANAFVAGDNALAADTLGMVDIATSLQYMSKTSVSVGGGITSVTGGTSKDIPMDKGLDDPTYGWSSALKDDDVVALQDSSIDIDMNDVSDTYNVEDTLTFSSGIDVETAVTATSPDEDFEDNVFLEVGSDSIQYRYVFKESLKSGNYITQATSSDTIDIKFLGKSLKISGADSDSITAQVGDELFMKVGDTATVEGKSIKLENVGNSNNVVVTVDGVQKTISGTSSTAVNGIKVKIQDTFYTDTMAERSATLIVGEDAVKTYTNGDAYIGEDTDDPDWVWVIDISNNATPSIGIDFDQSWDTPETVLSVGDSIALPNDFVTVSLAALTQSKYKDYTFESNVQETVYNRNGNATNEDGAAPISPSDTAANKYRGLKISASGSSNDGFKFGSVAESDKILFVQNFSSSQHQYVGIYYWDTSNSPNKYRHYATINVTDGTVKDGTSTVVDYPKIQFDDALFNLTVSETKSGYYNLTIPASSDEEIYDLITLLVKQSSTEVKLGSGTTTQDGDLFVADADRGGWDKDIRTQDGIIIKKPKTNIDSDKFAISVPGDVGKEFRATVTVTGSSSVITKGGSAYSPVAITPRALLASEVSDPTAYNLIVVGGPCANSLAETVFGVSCSGWSLGAGEAMVKMAANGNKVAMLVAGTSAADTRRAAKAVSNYDKYSLSGAEVLVKGTTMSDITVEQPSA